MKKNNVRAFRLQGKGKFCYDCGKAIQMGKMVVTVPITEEVQFRRGKTRILRTVTSRVFLHVECFNPRHERKIVLAKQEEVMLIE